MEKRDWRGVSADCTSRLLFMSFCSSLAREVKAVLITQFELVLFKSHQTFLARQYCCGKILSITEVEAFSKRNTRIKSVRKSKLIKLFEMPESVLHKDFIFLFGQTYNAVLILLLSSRGLYSLSTRNGHSSLVSYWEIVVSTLLCLLLYGSQTVKLNFSSNLMSLFPVHFEKSANSN